MATITDQLSHLSVTKETIRQAIINKGVPVPTSTPFRQFANKIATIPQEGGGSGGDCCNIGFEYPNVLVTEETPYEEWIMFGVEPPVGSFSADGRTWNIGAYFIFDETFNGLMTEAKNAQMTLLWWTMASQLMVSLEVISIRFFQIDEPIGTINRRFINFDRTAQLPGESGMAVGGTTHPVNVDINASIFFTVTFAAPVPPLLQDALQEMTMFLGIVENPLNMCPETMTLASRGRSTSSSTEIITNKKLVSPTSVLTMMQNRSGIFAKTNVFTEQLQNIQSQIDKKETTLVTNKTTTE